MGAQQVKHLSSLSTWIFIFFFLSACSGMDAPKFSLESTVFVAFAGEDLHIDSELRIPFNMTGDILTCSDPLRQEIYRCDIPGTTVKPLDVKVALELKNLTSSGEYSCQYKTARVYWFLRVRSESNSELEMLDYRESIVVAVFTVLLLVFSVVGSVFVFRGHENCITRCGDIGRNREERTKREVEENNVDAITAPSTSFYASLEARPRSIYDELDLSAANIEPDQNKAKRKKKKPKERIAQTTQDQHEGVFESVYENF